MEIHSSFRNTENAELRATEIRSVGLKQAKEEAEMLCEYRNETVVRVFS